MVIHDRMKSLEVRGESCFRTLPFHDGSRHGRRAAFVQHMFLNRVHNRRSIYIGQAVNELMPANNYLRVKTTFERLWACRSPFKTIHRQVQDD